MEFSMRMLFVAIAILVVVLIIVSLVVGWSGGVNQAWGNTQNWFNNILGIKVPTAP